jgi:hypothetical protein
VLAALAVGDVLALRYAQDRVRRRLDANVADDAVIPGHLVASCTFHEVL